ncbi:response regulator, partial [Chitinivibrio alkaliphilus]|uniref:response regulator n=1 Tax=Chitinivibrio alkaliphilus TaxID=1505232 RepID=UPI0012DD9723
MKYDMILADDDNVSNVLLQNYLEHNGITVSLAHNGKEAEELLQKADGPRLLLLDWEMPYTSGAELCQIVKNDYSKKYPMYSILLTGRADIKHVIEGLNTGADDYIKKPYDMNELWA